ncbi:hypothetical protein Pflav_047440 [Phytohabitans flavus]|uniref:DhaL domain-containing protein n=1 Tax=Phytohabitans flavus TaxID=1076124 RepID=A0A6F8XWW0_9ACTN|nr:hypothetical protein Pflav_047440 [Phytohabitans flavus]
MDGGILRGLSEGTAANQRVGEARVGDRTLVDCLAPTLDGAAHGRGPGRLARDRGRRAGTRPGHRRTHPAEGRASYVGERAVGNPDAGAMGVALLFWALALYRDPTSRHRLTPPAGI